MKRSDDEVQVERLIRLAQRTGLKVNGFKVKGGSVEVFTQSVEIDPGEAEADAWFKKHP